MLSSFVSGCLLLKVVGSGLSKSSSASRVSESINS